MELIPKRFLLLLYMWNMEVGCCLPPGEDNNSRKAEIEERYHERSYLRGGLTQGPAPADAGWSPDRRRALERDRPLTNLATTPAPKIRMDLSEGGQVPTWRLLRCTVLSAGDSHSICEPADVLFFSNKKNYRMNKNTFPAAKEPGRVAAAAQCVLTMQNLAMESDFGTHCS